jgi:hypothetical protein
MLGTLPSHGLRTPFQTVSKTPPLHTGIVLRRLDLRGG